MPEWSYPNEYNPCPPSYDHNFHNNFNSSQSSWGLDSPESNFQPPSPPYPPCPQYSHDSYSDPPIQNRKPSILKMMSMHESKQQLPSIVEMMSMRESKQQSQNLTDSQLHHDCPNNTSSFQVQSQNDAQSTMKRCLKP